MHFFDILRTVGWNSTFQQVGLRTSPESFRGSRPLTFFLHRPMLRSMRLLALDRSSWPLTDLITGLLQCSLIPSWVIGWLSGRTLPPSLQVPVFVRFYCFESATSRWKGNADNSHCACGCPEPWIWVYRLRIHPNWCVPVSTMQSANCLAPDNVWKEPSHVSFSLTSWNPYLSGSVIR